MLDPKRERIQDDLRGLLAGEVHCDTVYTQLYAVDASIYQEMPLGVIFPQTTLDVVAAIRYARQHSLSIHPRGAGSYCAGGSLGEGLILDFSRYMRRILTLGDDTVRVQAGVQVSRLNEFLRPSGLIFSPDPGNSHATTVGGMISVDGYGSHWISSGRPSDWLLSLEMVTAEGNILSWGRNEKMAEEPADAVSGKTKKDRGAASSRTHVFRREQTRHSAADSEKRRILGALRTTLLQNQDVILQAQNHGAISRMGYRLNILRDDSLDVAGMIAAAEGTLGVITSVTLRLQKIPPHRMTALLLFESMEKAVLAVQSALALQPNSCDLMDRRHIRFASERDVRFDVLFPPRTEAALLVDFSDTSRFSLYDQLRKVETVLVRQKELAFQMIPAWDEDEEELFWSLTNTSEPFPRWSPGGQSPMIAVEDVAVPPAVLHPFILKTQELLRHFKMIGAIYAHAAQGQVRLLPLLDKTNPTDMNRLKQFSRAYYGIVKEMDGTLGAEYGNGLARTFLLPAWLGNAYEISCRVKDIFDPDRVFHPGKLGTRPAKMKIRGENEFLAGEFFRRGLQESVSPKPTADFGESRRTVSAVQDISAEKEHPAEEVRFRISESHDASGEPERRRLSPKSAGSFSETDTPEKTEKNPPDENSFSLQPVTEMGLEWNASQLKLVSQKCNGCGDCRSIRKNRMCPMFHASFCESASPRAKVNLMEGLLAGPLELPELGSEYFHAVSRQCFQCHSCRLECAANVDIPFLMRRAEEAWARARGLNFYESVLVRMDRWTRIFRVFAPLVNLNMKSPWGRWITEKIFGIARARKLPTFEKRSFLEEIKREKSVFPSDEMVFADDDSPGIADSFSAREDFHPRPETAESGREIREKAVYFVDTYANFFDVSLAWATKNVFDHNGIPLLVPKLQTGSGLSAVILGRSDYVQKQILRNAAILADYVRQGFDIILTEPAAVLAMQWEFPQIFPDSDDILLVSKHVFDACDYLWKFHLKGKLKLPTQPLPMTLGYHAPCRLLALNAGTPGANLLGLIPELEIRHSAAGCCGMGGTFGLLESNYAVSLRMGRKLHLWLRSPELGAGVTECSACKMQMEQSSSKPTVHPLKILALVYGRMPELESALRMYAPELVLT